MPSPFYRTGLSPFTIGLETGDPNLSVVGTGLSIPWGIDAVFEYNGFLFNDRTTVDKIRVTGIDGLDDADVRDTREDNPVEDGETEFDSLYGGRTLVFNGRIEAFQRDKLRDMQQAFRTAFLDISRERPLHFLTNNASTHHYINCKKSSSIKWTEEQKTHGVYFRDFQLTLRASDARFLRNQKTSIDIDPDTDTNTTLSNFGNFSSKPTITIFGGMTDVEFNLEYSDTVLVFKLKDGVEIADGDFYKLDMRTRSIKNSDGDSVFNDVDTTSDFFKLPTGLSSFVIPAGKCNTTSGNAGINIQFRDSYL